MNTSQGEQKIINILQNTGVNFKREYNFKDLKSLKGRPLRLDFVIFNAEKMPIFAIEYDGQQHFIYNKYFSKSYRDFQYKMESDLRKNEYCLAHRLPLYRIPYYDFDNLNNYQDLFKPEYLVQNRWHNFHICQRLKKLN